MRIINILKDGSTRASMEGVVVRQKDFYQIIKTIKKEKTKCSQS